MKATIKGNPTYTLNLDPEEFEFLVGAVVVRTQQNYWRADVAEGPYKDKIRQMVDKLAAMPAAVDFVKHS